MAEAKRASWQDIWRAGSAISGGFGFWGHSITHGPDAPVAVKIWVEELRKRGYSDADIVLYGDWTDGRHIADGMEGASPAKMREEIRRNAVADPASVHSENISSYRREDVASALFRNISEDAARDFRERRVELGISPVAGTKTEDWFEVHGGPPGDDKTFLAYSMPEAQAVMREREKAAYRLGYTVVHVESYRREKNGREESVTDHDRRQRVRMDAEPSMQPLRRRRT